MASVWENSANYRPIGNGNKHKPIAYQVYMIGMVLNFWVHRNIKKYMIVGT